MRAKKTFTGVRGVPSMKVRGGGNNELERLRVQKLATPQAGDWAITSASAACDRRLGRASPVHMLTLLGKYRDAKTGRCYVHMKRLARELGITRRMAQMHIGKLINAGYLMVIPQRRTAGGYTSNCFVLLYPKFKSANALNDTLDAHCAEEEQNFSILAKVSFA